MKLVILIPAYNESATIKEVIEKIPRKFEEITHIDILVVNDGSQDHTAEIAKKSGAIVHTHKINQGVGVAFQSGLAKAMELKADILVTIDADLQFDAEEIPKIIKPILDEKADFVTGSRFIDKSYTPKNMPWIKKWGNHRIARLISWATGRKFHDVSCGFRAYGKEAMLRLNLFGKFTYTQETFLDLAYKGLQIVEIPVTVKYFAERKSRVAGSITNYAYKAGNIIFRTIKDYRPLKFFGWSGFMIFLLGLGLDVFVFYHFFLTGSFSPYKIIGFLGAFLNAIGIMIFFLGILADLIDKIRLTQEKILYYERLKIYKEK